MYSNIAIRMCDICGAPDLFYQRSAPLRRTSARRFAVSRPARRPPAPPRQTDLRPTACIDLHAARATTLAAILPTLETLLRRTHPRNSITNLGPAKLGYSFFRPIGLIIIAVA